MTKRIAALAAVLALTLTGCAGGASNASEERVAPAAVDSPAPLIAEEANSATPVDDADAEFAAYVRSELLPDTGIADASDEQLVQAGQDACELLIAGTDSETIRLVEGEQPAASGYFMDTAAIIDGARRFYCPETIH